MSSSLSPPMLCVHNKELYDFYTTHSIDFEQANVLLYQFLKTLIPTSSSSSTSSTSTSSSSSSESMMAARLTHLEHSLQQMLDKQAKQQLNDMKLLQASHDMEHVLPFIRNANEALLAQMTLAVQSANKDDGTSSAFVVELNKCFASIEHQLSATSSTLAHEMRVLEQHLSTVAATPLTATASSTTASSTTASSTNLAECFANVEQNVEKVVQQQLATVTTLLALTEQRLEQHIQHLQTMQHSKIDEIVASFNEHKHANDLLQQGVSDMLKKFEKGSGKGNISEQVLYNMLLSMFPCAQIDFVGDIKESGDILLSRTNKPKILLENKDHDTCNVPKADVDKFIRDCDIQQCSGIMFSQNRGISNKENFELQVHNGNVLLFVHHVKFDPDKIKCAIHIVEEMKLRLDELQQESNTQAVVIDSAVLKEISNEVNAFHLQKTGVLKLVKDFQERMAASLNDLKLPALEAFLSKHFATSAPKITNQCEYCQRLIPKSMSQHLRHCSSKRLLEQRLQQEGQPQDTGAR